MTGQQNKQCISSRLVGFLSALIVSLIILATAQSSFAVVDYGDGDFTLSQWQTTAYYLGNGGTIGLNRVSSGGNPGVYLRVDHLVNRAPGGSNSSIVYGLHTLAGATYNPITDGAIDTIDFSILYNNIDTAASGMAFGMALRQNGNIYGIDPIISGTASGWQSVNKTSLQESDFGLKVKQTDTFITDFNQNPDFSGSGSLIELGLFTWNSNTSTDVPAIEKVGFDNWAVTVNNVPEPMTLSLLALGSLFMRSLKKK